MRLSASHHHHEKSRVVTHGKFCFLARRKIVIINNDVSLSSSSLPNLPAFSHMGKLESISNYLAKSCNQFYVQ